MLGVDPVLSGGAALIVGVALGAGVVGTEIAGASTDAGMDMVVELSVNLTSHSTDTFCCPGQ